MDRRRGCTCRPALEGRLETGHGEEFVEDFFKPFAGAANFPWQSHALWFYTQMVRWNQCAASAANAAIAASSYRPDYFRRALKPAGAILPGASSKVEGALKAPLAAGSLQGNLVLGPDGLLRRPDFDPDALEAYLAG